MAEANFTNPDSKSSDYLAMEPYWDLIDAILGGIVTMREAGTQYLPKFPDETNADYDYRLRTTKFTNVFRDIVENLAAKPFADEANVGEDADELIQELAENIDGQGNHIHVFAGQVFFNGIAYGIDWILVDYTKNVPKNATVKQEQELGARPYWVEVPAKKLLAAYSTIIEGKEEFVHVRMREDYKERDGFGEKIVNCIRVLERPQLEETTPTGEYKYGPAIYQKWEQGEPNAAGVAQWEMVEEGPISIGVIPLVPFLTGKRKGGSWEIEPPMQDAAELQVQLYEDESDLKYAKKLTCFPMLSASGVEPKVVNGVPVRVPVGPRSVLYAPPGSNGASGSWNFIEPNATSLKFLADDNKETVQQLRELGRQPLTAQTGNLTVITTQFAAQKGNSAIQAWALKLKDAMENCLRYTEMWLEMNPEQEEDEGSEFLVNLDFDVSMMDEKGPDILTTMRGNGDLSQRTYWHELRRRSILSPEFDPDEEEELLLAEVPGEPEEGELGMEGGGEPSMLSTNGIEPSGTNPAQDEEDLIEEFA